MKTVWENINESDEGLIVKAAKKAYGCVKNKIVAILTCNTALSGLGTVISLLSFLPGIDRDKVQGKMKEMSKSLNDAVDNVDVFLKSVPVLSTLFEDERQCFNNILRFCVFAQQISLGQYPAENYDLKNVVLV